MRKQHTESGSQLLAVTTAEQPFGGLKKLFIEELKDIYWAEKALSLVLPKVVDGTSSEELADEILDHMALTLNHVTRLEVIFSALGVQREATKCESMASLIKEVVGSLSVDKPNAERDMDIVSVCKRIQYYKITSYGILCAFAKSLGEIKVMSLLESILSEEREVYASMISAVESINSANRTEDSWRFFDFQQRA